MNSTQVSFHIDLLDLSPTCHISIQKKQNQMNIHAEKSGWAKVKGQWVARYWSGELRETSQTMVGWWGQEFGLAFNIMKTC